MQQSCTRKSKRRCTPFFTFEGMGSNNIPLVLRAMKLKSVMCVMVSFIPQSSASSACQYPTAYTKFWLTANRVEYLGRKFTFDVTELVL